MNELIITPTLVVALVPLYIFLIFRVASYRRRNKISLRTDTDKELFKRVRTHGNFIETVPMFAIICLLGELRSANTTVLMVFAALFVFGRHSHAIGVSTKHFVFRPIGMVLTIFTTVASTVLLASTLIK